MRHQEKRILRRNQFAASRPFNLQQTFAVLGLICIAAISGGAAVVLTRFMSAELLERDAVVNMEVIQAVASVENLGLALAHPNDPGDHEHGTAFFAHVASLPDVLRVAVYDRGGTILWSSDAGRVGTRVNENEDLQRALTGLLVFKFLDRGEHFDEYRQEVTENVDKVMETYIPIWNAGRDKVLGVVEIYKLPRAIEEAIKSGNRLIWLTGMSGAVFLYVTLFWIVRRATIAMRAQQERLVESETMAAIGEMASGIAHDIRSPLASIRTTAELALEEPPENRSASHESAQDIILEVDRLERIIRDLILMARPEREELSDVCIAEMIRSCIRDLEPVLARQSITARVDIHESLSSILGDRPVLHLALNNVLSNAVDAMPNGGSLAVTLRMTDGGDHLEVIVADSGHGIPEDRLQEVFKPFVTSKPRGLGLGLALTKRIVERHHGTIAMTSEEGRGTTVIIRLPAGVE